MMYDTIIKLFFNVIVQEFIDAIRGTMSESIRQKRLTAAQVVVFRERLETLDRVRNNPEEWPDWLAQAVAEYTKNLAVKFVRGL